MDSFFIDFELEIEELEEIEFDLEEVIIGGGALPYYKGPYEAVPKRKEQKLLTKEKSMSKDVTIFEIPYSETANPEGGTTYIIGGEL